MSFVIGRGTIVEVALLPEGNTLEPTAVSALTTTGSAAKGATTVTLTGALGSNIFIPANTYLGFVLTTGATVTAKLTADADTGDTTLTVAALPIAISAGAIATYPLKLANRTDANLERSGNVTTLTTFDDDSWESGRTTSLNATLSLPGAWSQLDPAYNTVEYAFGQGLDVYFWEKFTAPSSAYQKGTIFKGIASITSLPVNNSASGVITGDIGLKVNGALIKVDPVPTA